jgi:hypothetical protein
VYYVVDETRDSMPKGGGDSVLKKERGVWKNNPNISEKRIK